MPRKKQRISTGYTTCNKVELVCGGKDYFNLILSIIGKAEDSVHLQTYIFEDDSTGRQVADALKEAASRGVNVYLLLDGYASQGLSKEFIASLTGAGIHFRFFEPLLKSRHFYFGRRLHHKILVVDAKYAVTGSKNVSDRYNDLPGAVSWLDFTVYLEGQIAQELCEVCIRTWNGFGTGKRVGHCNIEPVKGDMQVRIRRNDWVRRKNQISATYNEMLRKSHSHITILCSYFLPGKKIRNLMKKACDRGVKITVIVAGKSDVLISKNAERWLYDWMLRNGISIYEYESSVLHAKAAACDSEWLTIGSFNINNISAYASIELNVDVKDAHFTKAVEKTMRQIIEQECIPITRETHLKAKNLWRQFTRWLSYQTIRVLFYLVTFYYRQNG